MIETFRDRLRRVMDKHAAEVAAGHVHRDATVAAVAQAPEPTDVAALHREVARLRALLDDVLGHFTQKGHPGEPCVRTSWIPERLIARWQLAARGLPVDALRRGGLAVLDGAGAASLRDRDGTVWTPDGDGTYSALDGTLSGWRRADVDAQYGPVIEVAEPVSGSDGAR